MTQGEAHRLMCDADRDRARIAYRGLRDNMSDTQEQRVLARNRATPEYKEANNRFKKYSAIVGEKGPAALSRMF